MSEEPKQLGTLPFVLAGVSYIPLVGIPFGIAAIVLGLVTKRGGGRRLAAVGAGGILLSVVLYSGLFYFGFVQRGGVYDDLRAQLARTNLSSLVQAIEFYKTQNGQYPASLEQLQASLPSNSLVFINDPSDVRLSATGRPFHYELVGTSNYYLRGVGPDGVSFTPDDILPPIEVRPSGSVGLLVTRP